MARQAVGNVVLLRTEIQELDPALFGTEETSELSATDLPLALELIQTHMQCQAEAHSGGPRP